jgi:amino acid transporter
MAELKRSINLPLLVLYGLGTIVGGGIYALLGKVAGSAGMSTPFAVGLTGLLALLSAFSFAELAARFPVSAGEAYYVRQGFGVKRLASLVGWMVILSGVVSAATLSVALVGFLQDAWPALNTHVGIILVVLAMGAIAAWGIGQSVGVVTAITVLEVGALVYVLAINGDAFGKLPERFGDMLPGSVTEAGAGGWMGMLGAAFLAFYAYIGFEDMVNMAEEVKDSRRTLPKAILISVLVAAVIYVLIAIVAVLTVPIDKLAASKTPLAELVTGSGWWSTTGIWIVSMLAGVNGALVQIIMGSRVAYGMARKGQAPAFLGMVNPFTRTPIRATALVILIILMLALFLPLTTLAQITSSILLLVFVAVNLSLWRIKGVDPDPPEEGLVCFPRWLPLVAALVTFGVLIAKVLQMIG